MYNARDFSLWFIMDTPIFTGTLPFTSQPNRPYIALAPMEGLMDHHLRQLLTSVGGIDHCVTEFIRVTDHVYPGRVFKRYCPELLNGGKTASGTPVHVQLLGSDPDMLAENAVVAAELGAPAIDLNFGCPAKTVNKSNGGAYLLQFPELLAKITTAVRKAVPSHIPVSAKMRLGYTHKENALENAQALASGGIQWLTVHARTKTEGYKPPAYWQWIPKIQAAVNIPVIANGEIWTPDNARQCIAESGSNLIMIGRGLVSMPDLAMQIKADHNLATHTAYTWQQHLDLFLQLVPMLNDLGDKQLTDRLKQWLFYFTRHYPEITDIFEEVKKTRDRHAFLETIKKRR